MGILARLRETISASLLLILLAAVAVAGTGELPSDLQAKLDSLPDSATRIDLLNDEIGKAPDDASLHFAVANLYFDDGQLDSAVSELQKVCELDPGFLGGYVNLGNAYDELGQLDLALATYESALKIAPTDEKTLCNMGGVYFKKRQVDQALASFQSAIEYNPKSQLAHYNMAILFADAEIYREAGREWQKAVDIDPESDLGRRSAENIKIIQQLMSSEMPELNDSGSD